MRIDIIAIPATSNIQAAAIFACHLALKFLCSFFGTSCDTLDLLHANYYVGCRKLIMRRKSRGKKRPQFPTWRAHKIFKHDPEKAVNYAKTTHTVF